MAVDSATSRLQAYITFRTKVLPDDAELYQNGFKYEGLCLFCKNPNARHPVISQGVDTNTCMCNWCKDTVDKELDSSALEHEYFIKEKSLLASLNPAYNFILPDDIAPYLTHIEIDKDFYTNSSSRCYICDRLPTSKPYETEEFETVPIPIRSHSQIIAGHINICPNKVCAEIRIKYKQALSKLYFVNGRNMSVEISDYKCITCNNIYSILGADEIFHRSTAPDSVEWQCPVCAYKMINAWKNKSTLNELQTINLDKIAYRTIDKVCQACSEYTTIDLLNTEFTIHLNHILHNKIVCRECSLLRIWLELETVCKVMNTRIYIELHNSDYTFSIYRLKKGTLEAIITNGNTGATNPIDNLLLAFEELQKLAGNNLDLWS